MTNSCCPSKQPKKSPCSAQSGCSSSKKGFDLILHGSASIIIATLIISGLGIDLPYIDTLASKLIELFKTMWWGVALGIITAGLMNEIPKEYFTHIMGRGTSGKDIFKAALAGVLLDICNHGILLMASKLYERGLSAAQVMTFLIASPWNSLTLTFILISLIGWYWTLIFTLASMLIAFISGLVYLYLTKRDLLPHNPHTVDVPQDFNIKADMKARLSGWRPSLSWAKKIAHDGWHEGQMIIRWILFGTLLAAALSTFTPEHMFESYLGPTILGLFVTLVIATIIEVCSEGSAPIAAEIMHNGGAAGNGFTFLMAGVSTDYTEIMVVREFTKSWRIALSLPLITVPQIIIIAIIMNIA